MTSDDILHKLLLDSGVDERIADLVKEVTLIRLKIEKLNPLIRWLQRAEYNRQVKDVGRLLFDKSLTMKESSEIFDLIETHKFKDSK